MRQLAPDRSSRIKALEEEFRTKFNTYNLEVGRRTHKVIPYIEELHNKLLKLGEELIRKYEAIGNQERANAIRNLSGIARVQYRANVRRI